VDITYLGTLEGTGPLAIHAASQQAALVYVGKLRLDQHLRVYSAASLTSFQKYSGAYDSSLAWSPSGKFLAVTETFLGDAISGNWRIRGAVVMPSVDGRVPFRAKMNYAGGPQGSNLAAYSPDETLLALSSRGNDPMVYVVDAHGIRNYPKTEKESTGFATLMEIRESGVQSNHALAWSPSGEYLAQMDYETILNPTAPVPHLVMWKFARTPESISVSNVGSIPLYDAIGKSEHSPYRHISFTTDSTRLVIGGGNTVPLRLVDVREMKVAHEMPYGGPPMTALVSLPDGKHVLSGDEGGVLCAWELLTPDSEPTLNLVDSARVPGPILDLSPSSDGTFAIFGWKRDPGHVDLCRLSLPSATPAGA
jgi:WD40 repeat protein